MKTASKILLIIGGVFAILATLSFAYLALYDFLIAMLGTIAAFVGLILLLVGTGNDSASLISSGGMTFGYGTIFAVGGFVLAVIFAIFTLFLLIVAVSAFVGLIQKRPTSIINIVFGSLTFIPAGLFAIWSIYALLFFIIYFFAMIIFLLTPVGWMYVAMIGITIFSAIAALLIQLGGVFGLIGSFKKKEEVME